jgi:hypothetical protein
MMRDGLIQPPDHLFRAAHYPPNGRGCWCEVCGARTLEGARRQRRGRQRRHPGPVPPGSVPLCQLGRHRRHHHGRGRRPDRGQDQRFEHPFSRHRIARDVVSRDLVRDYLGGSDHLIGARRTEVGFDIEVAGSGTAGVAPPYGKLLRACGMAETVVPDSDVEYTPVSEDFERLTLRYVTDGACHLTKGCRGTVKFDLTACQRPMMRFKFAGYDYRSSTSTISAAFCAGKRPLVIMDANSGDIRLGGTYTGGGNVAGGTTLASRGLVIDLNNTVSHLKLLGGEAIGITNNVTTRLGFNFGTTAGNKVVIFAPKVQRIDPQGEDYEGSHLMSTELRLLPAAGDDELTFTVK